MAALWALKLKCDDKLWMCDSFCFHVYNCFQCVFQFWIPDVYPAGGVNLGALLPDLSPEIWRPTWSSTTPSINTTRDVHAHSWRSLNPNWVDVTRVFTPSICFRVDICVCMCVCGVLAGCGKSSLQKPCFSNEHGWQSPGIRLSARTVHRGASRRGPGECVFHHRRGGEKKASLR